mmetsp:Transcript_95916/g.222356  ORF Transcript_95916/g.222356 Transcript_95916/m.222356 type:complete len:537 (-) Transcript_95916:102-1712(-)
MAPTADKPPLPAWYRIYVLLVLLSVIVCCLATRNLPSYLITVPVPDCEAVCKGVTTSPLCGRHVMHSFPADRSPTRKEACKLCRLRVLPHEAQPLSMVLRPLLHRQKATLWGAVPDETNVLDAGLPWAEGLGEDAAFYNIADGSCLYHWEYGILIGYGFALVYAIGAVPAGWVCDRRPRVAVLSTSLLAWSVATSMQAASHNFIFLLGCRAVVGLSQAFCMPAAFSLTADYFSERQNLAVAVLSLGGYFGSGCASFSILFTGLLGWRWAVLLAGLMGVALTPVLYHTVNEPERSTFSAPCSNYVVRQEIFEKSRVARMLIVASSGKMLAAASLSAFLPIWYSRRGLNGYTSTGFACWNALVVCLGGLLAAVLGHTLGRVWGRYDARAPCWVGLLGAIFSIPLLCVILLTPSFGASMLCFFLLLLLGEAWLPPTMTLLQGRVRQSVRGQAVSLFLAVATLAANVGPALVGILDPGGERVGLHLLWISLTANVIAGVFFLLTAWEIKIDPVETSGGDSSRGSELASKTEERRNLWGIF